MRVFQTYSELKAALDAPALEPGAFRFAKAFAPAGFMCAGCGNACPFHFEGGGTGYGLDRETNAMRCYACCTADEAARMRKHAGPFYAYLNSDGNRVTSWPGGELGRVHALGTSRSGWQGSEIARFHVRDVHGNWWSGRGAGRGMACTLRPMKAPSYAASWGRA